MLLDVVEVKPLDEYRLFLRFENDVSGEIDLAKKIDFKGIFAPLKDFEYFKKVYINKDLGTIVWENHADLSPEFLYECITSENT